VGFLSVLRLRVWSEVSTGLQRAAQKGRKPSRRGGDSRLDTGAPLSQAPRFVERVSAKTTYLVSTSPAKAIRYLWTVHVLPCAFSIFWEVGAKPTCPVDWQKSLTRTVFFSQVPAVVPAPSLLRIVLQKKCVGCRSLVSQSCEQTAEVERR